MKIKDIITKSEMVYLSLLSFFVIAVYFILKLTSFENEVSTLAPVYQFLLMNIGFFLILTFGMTALSLKKKQKWKGALGSTLIITALSVWSIPWHITLSGSLINGGTFGQGATDYFFATIWQSLGFVGTVLWFMVYLVTPILLLVIGGYFVRNFVKEI
jgi:DMSO/TMAO reductase YedYZ heme-binding membrane subunit